jgi:hypothetical protein
MAYRNYSTAVSHIVDTTGQGDFKTIGAALAAASSGQTIFVRPGTYTENITLPGGIHLSSFAGDELLPSVTIVGKVSFSAATISVISGISLQTNSDYFLSVTGASAAVLYLEDCYLNASNHTGINYTTSNTSSQIRMTDCTGAIGTTSIAFFSCSGTGSISFIGSIIGNDGMSTTASVISSGSLNIIDSTLLFPSNVSGTTTFFCTNSTIDCAALNTTALTLSTSAIPNYCEHSNFQSGTAVTITINSPGNLIMSINNVNTTNADAITGTGTLNAGIITFTSTGSTITTSTVNKLTTYGGTIV